MTNPEKTIIHRFPLGFGADYMIETGQIFIDNRQVGKLGLQANAIFEMLLYSRGVVGIDELAQADGSKLLESNYDYFRVQSAIGRIRKTLKKISPDLANKLQTVLLDGYRWGDPDEFG